MIGSWRSETTSVTLQTTTESNGLRVRCLREPQRPTSGGSRNKATRAVAEWTAAILEDEQVQARLLSDARQGRLHHAVLGQLLLYAYGRPATSSSPEATIPFSVLADARASLRVKLDQMRDVLEMKST